TLARADGSPPLHLVAEFFAPGNLLLVLSSRLVVVAKPRTFAHRTLRVGSVYTPPPERPNAWEASPAQIEVILLGSRTDRASTLAARAGFGGPIAEELLRRANLPGDVPALV